MIRCLAFALITAPTFICAAQQPSNNFAGAIEDAVYEQTIGRKIATENPVTRVVGQAGERAYLLEGDRFSAIDGFNGDIRFLNAAPDNTFTIEAFHDEVWALTDSAMYRLDGGKWVKIAEGNFSAMCLHLGQVIVASSKALYTLVDGQLKPLPHSDSPPYRIEHLVSHAETLYAASGDRLFIFDGRRYDRINVLDWGDVPLGEIRDVLSVGSRIYLATSRGLGVVQGMTLSLLTGEDGLPYEDTTSLAFDGTNLWIGTTIGAVRMTPQRDFHYFQGQRWLPNDRVNAIACITNGPVYLATEGGLGIVDSESYTLEKKAAYYERHLEEWGHKRLGFVHKLFWVPEKGGWIREVSDNDAGWSTHYLAAQCFKYAVTGDPVARAEAVKFFNSLKWTEEITPIDGFPARSIWQPGEVGIKAAGGSGGFPAEWHPTEDGKWEWKGDTSSDEIDAHIYATAIFHDLVAQGGEKARAKEHLDRILSHIIDNGWVLRDLDGKPTVWARWDPEYFSSDRGHYARGLNGLEILSYVRTTWALTGKAKFEKAYNELLKMGYHREVLRQKLVFPPDDVFHSDDRLAFYVYHPLLTYETDPYLRSIYRRSLERSWEVERIEHNPWFNFIYGGLTGNDCDAEESVRHLRDWPLDLIKYSYRNSHRHDLHTPDGYSDHTNVVRKFSPRETGPMRWSDTPRLDGGEGGRSVVDPSGWLDAYWMGRYYGIILPPATLTTVSDLEDR